MDTTFKLMILTPIEACWLACALDTEGHISLFKTGHKYLALRVGITNTNLEFLHQITNLVGGSIIEKRGPTRVKRAYQWQVYGIIKVYEFLKAISPWLIIKREKAKIAIDYCEYRMRYKNRARGPKRPYDKKDWAFEKKFNQKILVKEISHE